MWTVRLADDAVIVSPRGNVVTVDARDVALVDRGPVSAGETPAKVSLQMTWKGGGGRRPLARRRRYSSLRSIGVSAWSGIPPMKGMTWSRRYRA